MLAGERDEVAVGDLIRAGHQFRPHYAVGATHVVGHEPMARVGEQVAKPSWTTRQVAKAETPLNHERVLACCS
jgi:hypothetical protein